VGVGTAEDLLDADKQVPHGLAHFDGDEAAHAAIIPPRERAGKSSGCSFQQFVVGKQQV
jgi:hypothetical protein